MTMMMPMSGVSEVNDGIKASDVETCKNVDLSAAVSTSDTLAKPDLVDECTFGDDSDISSDSDSEYCFSDMEGLGLECGLPSKSGNGVFDTQGYTPAGPAVLLCRRARKSSRSGSNTSGASVASAGGTNPECRLSGPVEVAPPVSNAGATQPESFKHPARRRFRRSSNTSLASVASAVRTDGDLCLSEAMVTPPPSAAIPGRTDTFSHPARRCFQKGAKTIQASAAAGASPAVHLGGDSCDALPYRKCFRSDSHTSLASMASATRADPDICLVEAFERVSLLPYPKTAPAAAPSADASSYDLPDRKCFRSESRTSSSSLASVVRLDPDFCLGD